MVARLFIVSWKTAVQFRTLDRNGINMLTVDCLGQETEQISWTDSDYEFNTQVSFGKIKIATTHSLKLLGLTVDTFLAWKCHMVN